jgi:hypothetical protein
MQLRIGFGLLSLAGVSLGAVPCTKPRENCAKISRADMSSYLNRLSRKGIPTLTLSVTTADGTVTDGRLGRETMMNEVAVSRSGTVLRIPMSHIRSVWFSKGVDKVAKVRNGILLGVGGALLGLVSRSEKRGAIGLGVGSALGGIFTGRARSWELEIE